MSLKALRRLVVLTAVVMTFGTAAPADPVQYPELDSELNPRADRIARKALKRYLLEATALDRVVRNLRGERRREEVPKGAFDYGLSISGGAAKLELRKRIGAGGLRVGLDTRGDVRLAFAHSRLTDTRLVIGYDRRGKRCAFALDLRF
jgi:hypothetical protein